MSDTLTTRVASSLMEREAIYRLRYQVYVEEMGRPQKDADHARRRIEDDLDHRGHLVGAWRGGTLLGTVRTNLLAEGGVGTYHELYGLGGLTDEEKRHTTITTRMMVLAHARRGRVAGRLALAAYSFALARGMRHDFIDCNAHMVPFFEHLGYVPHASARHPDYGEVLVMRIDVTDSDLLERVGSPFCRPLRAWMLTGAGTAHSQSAVTTID